MQFASLIFEDNFILGAVAVLLLAFLGGLTYVLQTGSKAKHSTAQLGEFAGKLTGIQSRDNLNALIQEHSNSAVSKPIKEWGETIVFQAHTGGATMKNVVDAEYYFGEDRIASDLFQNRIIAAFPGFLTAAGLVCTFLGLSNGLAGLDLGDVTKMQESVNSLVEGAGAAFVPSLFGVGLSVVLNIVTRSIQHARSTAIGRLERQIDDAVEKVSAEQLLSDAAVVQRESVSLQRESFELQQDEVLVLKELAEKMGKQVGESVAESVEKLSSSLRLAIADSLAPALEKLTTSVLTQNTQVFESLTARMSDGFAEVGREQARELNSGAEAIQSAVHSLAEGIGAVQAETKEVQALIGSQASILKDSAESVIASAKALESGAEKFEGIAGQIRELQDSTAEKFEDLLEQHTGIFANLESYTVTLPQLQGKISTAVQELSSAGARLAEYNAAASNALNTVTAETLTELTNSMTQQSAHARETYGKLSADLATSQAQMEAWLREYSELVGQHVNDRMDIWNTQSGAYATHMLTVSQTLQSVIADIQDQQHLVSEAVQQTKETSVEISSSHNRIATTLQASESTLPTLIDSIRALQGISERVLQVASAQQPSSSLDLAQVGSETATQSSLPTTRAAARELGLDRSAPVIDGGEITK